MAMWAPSLLLFLLAASLAPLAIWKWRQVKRTIREWEASLQWPKAPGRVIESQVLLDASGDPELPAFYFPRVAYQYVVDGTSYSSTLIAVRDLHSYHKAAAAIVARYPTGSDVQVSYNPQSPEISVLEPGSEGMGKMLFFAGAAFFVSLAMVAVGVAMPILKSLP